MKSDEIVSVNYHEAYCEAGHEVTYVPTVLFSYWWDYKILTSADIHTYTDLLFFCKKYNPLTLEWYAKELNCNIPTLQHRFDNLENAELIKTSISKQAGELPRLLLISPNLSIENNDLRLKRQVEENYVEQLRELHGKQKISSFHKIELSVEKNISLAK